MIFDSLCRLVEYSDTPLVKSLRRAALVRMPGVHESDMPTSKDSFRMLWQTMAIEDDISCSLIERVGTKAKTGEDRKSTKAIGLCKGDVFQFIDCCVKSEVIIIIGALIIVEDTQNLAFGISGLGVSALNESKESILLLGSFELPPGSYQTHAIQPKENDNSECSYHTLGKELLDSFAVTLAQATSACRPGTWVLKEQVSNNLLDVNQSKKIPRTHQRPRWIIITDKERNRYFNNDTKTKGGTKTPHPRRAHYRLIGENNKEKKYTWVRACWVGSQEAEIRGSRYKVELDL